MWIKNYKKPLLLAVLIAAVLAFAFWYGGAAPGAQGWTVAPLPETEQSQEMAAPDEGVAPPLGEAAGETAAPEEEEAPPAATPPSQPEQVAVPEETSAPPTAAPSAPTQAPAPAVKPAAPPQEQAPVAQALSCTLSISCATALTQSGLEAETADLLPENGWILTETSLSFSEGETVFDLLLRACQEAGIHLEFSKTPLYQSAYIEGIGNLYEFDCGSLSGWLYQVNGSFPNYGSSRHLLQNGDVICWVYTCDLGEDVGGGGASGQFEDT